MQYVYVLLRFSVRISHVLQLLLEPVSGLAVPLHCTVAVVRVLQPNYGRSTRPEARQHEMTGKY